MPRHGDGLMTERRILINVSHLIKRRLTPDSFPADHPRRALPGESRSGVAIRPRASPPPQSFAFALCLFRSKRGFAGLFKVDA
jgi:hypothetical protein